MRTVEELLDAIHATDEERRALAEVCRRIRKERAWQRRKQADKTMPRQAQFQGPDASEIVDDVFADLPPERLMGLMQALKAMDCFE